MKPIDCILVHRLIIRFRASAEYSGTLASPLFHLATLGLHLGFALYRSPTLVRANNQFSRKNNKISHLKMVAIEQSTIQYKSESFSKLKFNVFSTYNAHNKK